MKKIKDFTIGLLALVSFFLFAKSKRKDKKLERYKDEAIAKDAKINTLEFINEKEQQSKNDTASITNDNRSELLDKTDSYRD